MHKLRVACQCAWRVGNVQRRALHATAAAEEASWDDVAFRRRFLEELAADLGVREPCDWRNVTRQHVIERGGRPLLRQGTLLEALQQAFPEQRLQAHECLRALPASHWRSAENGRQFLEQLAAAHGVQTAADWRRVTAFHVRQRGGSGLLARHGSVVAMLRATYPERTWDELECRRQVSNAFWASQENCRRFLEKVAREHGVATPEDWSMVTRKHIEQMGGKSLFARFGSLHAALVASFPEFSFEERRCRRVLSRGYWEVAANRRTFMEEVRRAHGVEAVADWKRVGRREVAEAGGRSLLHRYDGSMFRLLQDVYPELGLVSPEQCRAHMPMRHWSSRENRRSFMQAAARQAGIDSSRPEEWRRLTSDQLADMGGAGLLRRYGSRKALLEDLFPDLFEGGGRDEAQAEGGVPRPDDAWVAAFRASNRMPARFWGERANVVQFVRYAYHRLGLSSLEEWHRVSQSHLAELGAGGLLQHMDWDAALRLAFPTATWERDALASRSKRSVQWTLARRLHQIFALEARADP